MAALKGAFINLGTGLVGEQPDIIVFQFNPDRVTRTPALVRPPAPSTGAGSRDTQQQPGQPGESISFSLRLDATDQLADASSIAAASGILPSLSALELLMVSRPGLPRDLSDLAGGPGPHLHLQERLPTILFFWGPYRILPVIMSSLSIAETLYDQLLNPIRAEISVNLQVLTEDQMITESTLARKAYAYNQGVKEAMAALNRDNAVEIRVSPSLSLSL